MNGTGSLVVIIGAVVGGFTGIAALIRTILEGPKMRTEAMTAVNAAAINTLDEIKKDAADMRLLLGEARLQVRNFEDRIDMLEDREDRYVRAVRLLAGYIAESHSVFERAGLVPPPRPLSNEDIDRLLRRFKNGD